jgi:hypothetical protein
VGEGFSKNDVLLLVCLFSTLLLVWLRFLTFTGRGCSVFFFSFNILQHMSILLIIQQWIQLVLLILSFSFLFFLGIAESYIFSP